MGGKGTGTRSPSMLDLIHLGRRRLFPPGGADLYRQVALLAGLGPGVEVLDVACGTGVALEYFVREHEVHGTGVETDPRLVSRVREHFKELGLASDVTLQEASPANLPFRGETFDVALGEVGLAASAEPAEAIRELVRVVRPGGWVVLVQLVWKTAVDELRQGILTDHLGAKPLMTVELRRILLEAGLRDLHIEDWTEGGPASRSRALKPFLDFAEMFTLGERLGILRRARKDWGWGGVRAAFHREMEVHRLLTRERVLGLSLLMSMKPAPNDPGS
jgi:ubiquinone/menaquinone biosynthesis C-methylase UbiE